MFKNYLKISIRNLLHHKNFSLINIFGFTVGMAGAILILLWIQDELSYDRFHKDAKNIYLVIREYNNEKGAVSSKLLGPALTKDLPDILQTTNFMPLDESFGVLIQNEDKVFEETIALAAPNFFAMFSYKCREGDPITALNDPNSIVLTEEMSKKYFGEASALGKSLDIVIFGLKRTVKITAVLENMPGNSQIQAKIIFPIAWVEEMRFSNWNTWNNQPLQTYIRVNNKCDVRELAVRIKECELRNSPMQNPQTLRYSLLPLTKIHLYGNGIKFLQTTGNGATVQIFSVIAFIILLIACINYMNLATALSLKRAREVGIKKAIGADRKSLAWQFLGESLFLSSTAAICSVFLVKFLLPEFNKLSGKNLVVRLDDPFFISLLLLVAVVTGFVSGCYPAIFISSFKPIQTLTGKLQMSSKSLFARKGLVVLQFAVSAVMIICTLVVANQLSFIRSSNLGMDRENILCIRNIGAANNRFEEFKNHLQQNPNILSLSRSEPMENSSWGNTQDVYWSEKKQNVNNTFWIMHTDCDLASTYGIEMSQGRFYSKQYPTDQTSAFVVNEAAVKSMDLKSPIGAEIVVWGLKGKIIGVAKDFHFSSFHTAIEPLIFRIPDNKKQVSRLRMISIRFKSGNLLNSLAAVEKAWKEHMRDIPFNFYFFDEYLNAQYRAEQRMGNIFTLFSILSIVLACLGLFGLALFSTEQKTKEIAVRKVLGASLPGIFLLTTREFTSWVLIANIIAWPVAFYAINKWLQNFAYRIDLTVWPFLLAGLFALVIALLTVSWQAIKAATANPVESLKYE